MPRYNLIIYRLWGGEEDYGGGGHMIFRRTKGEITENFGRITAWGTAQICLENEDIWWGDRESQQMLLGGDHFSEVTLKGRMFLVTHQF